MAAPLIAEAKALFLAIEKAAHSGLKYCVFEGDAKIAVDSLTTPMLDIPWLIDPIISYCLYLLSFIPCWHILHVKWEGNIFAHLLARHTLNCNMVRDLG